MDIKKFILEVYRDCKDIEKNLEEDIKFFMDHDPACKYFSTPLLFYKGFLGLATYRAAHCLWNNDRHTMALFFQNRASEVFGVDIHPAAKIRGAVMIDHATGVVIGETFFIWLYYDMKKQWKETRCSLHAIFFFFLILGD